jgi:Putative redox-active protein (C_GCAxxG_C_C)
MSETGSGISSLKTVGSFLNGRACSDTLFHVLNQAFENPLTVEERAVMPLAGGILQHGYQCGMIWGAALAAGAQAYRLLGPGPLAETRAIAAAQRIIESFRAQNSHTNCLEITEIDKSSSTAQMITYFLLKGGAVGCFRMAARYAPVAFSEIKGALSEEGVEAPPGPVSCSALLARKMGESDMHAVMAAGFAGGIGLSGGACGALGAAIWIASMKALREGAGKPDFQSPAALEIIDGFLKCTDYEFECSRIAGRKFESVGDHASYVCLGGCSKVLEVLAAR